MKYATLLWSVSVQIVKREFITFFVRAGERQTKQKLFFFQPWKHFFFFPDSFFFWVKKTFLSAKSSTKNNLIIFLLLGIKNDSVYSWKKTQKKPTLIFKNSKTVSDVFMVGTFPAKIFYNNFLNETETFPLFSGGPLSVTWKTKLLSSVFQKKKKLKETETFPRLCGGPRSGTRKTNGLSSVVEKKKKKIKRIRRMSFLICLSGRPAGLINHWTYYSSLLFF